MQELEIEAKDENLDTVLDMVNGQMEEMGFLPKTMIRMAVAVEEIFVNISHYAYGDKTGSAKIIVESSEEPKGVFITFIDSGIPYDPLEKEDPDITLSAEERQIGGLGIYMVKQTVDDIVYRYEDGKNILRIFKGV
ncbi:MAG: ATP-binding protein [Lachnospiraceae bacterium]|nr:ATP-binding protein [Lachnospiraceae bacterium]